MPAYEYVDYSHHASSRMAKRSITKEEVEIVLRNGDCHEAEDDTLEYELGHLRVVVVEYGEGARVVTVIRLRGER